MKKKDQALREIAGLFNQIAAIAERHEISYIAIFDGDDDLWQQGSFHEGVLSVLPFLWEVYNQPNKVKLMLSAWEHIKRDSEVSVSVH